MTHAMPPDDRPSRPTRRGPEAPLTLAEPAAKLHGFLDQFGLWSNFGISLLIPVVVGFFVPTSLPGERHRDRHRLVLGCALIGAVARSAPAAREPTMVIFRGLFGRAGSAACRPC